MKRAYGLITLLLLRSFVQASCIQGTPSHVSMSYRAPEGVGYCQGYGTASGFLTPNWQRKFQPFLDVRGHMFNNGRTASNIGIGSRFATGQWAVGANCYYDFRDARHLRTHQIGPGLEILNPYVDFRLNGYIPISNETGKAPPRFAFASGNTLYIRQKATTALPNIGAELGIPIPGLIVDPYFSVGSYYLFEKHPLGKRCGAAWGGMARLSILLFNGISIGGEVSYDREYKTRANGYVSLSFPLGPNTIRTSGKRWKNWYSQECFAAAKMQRRMTQGVIRQEIIPVCNTSRVSALTSGSSSGSSTVNCIFVNNSAPAGGTGTFEMPFQTIQEAVDASAAGNCIYVYGTGIDYTTPGPDALVIVPHDLLFLGSNIDHTVDGIVFPAQTAVAPALNHGDMFGVIFDLEGGVTSVNAFEFAGGFRGAQSSAPPGISGFTLLNSSVTTGLSSGFSYFNLFGLTNTIVRNNSFTTGMPFITTGFTIEIVEVSNNTIVDTDMTGFGGASIELNNISTSASLIQNNTITAPMNVGIRIRVIQNNPLLNTVVIDGNTVSSGNEAIVVEDQNGLSSVIVSNNTVSSSLVANGIFHQFEQPAIPPFYDNYASYTNNVALTNSVRAESLSAPFGCFELLGNTATTFSLEDLNMVDSMATVTTSNTGPVVTAGTVTYSSGCTSP